MKKCTSRASEQKQLVAAIYRRLNLYQSLFSQGNRTNKRDTGFLQGFELGQLWELGKQSTQALVFVSLIPESGTWEGKRNVKRLRPKNKLEPTSMSRGSHGWAGNTHPFLLPLTLVMWIPRTRPGAVYTHLAQSLEQLKGRGATGE